MQAKDKMLRVKRKEFDENRLSQPFCLLKARDNIINKRNIEKYEHW
jgi:hypothetical protein